MKLESLQKIAGIIQGQIDHYNHYVVMNKYTELLINAEKANIEKELLLQEVTDEIK